MNHLALLLFTLSTVIFSCRIDKGIRYYSVVTKQNSTLHTNNYISESYCKVVNRDTIIEMFFVDKQGLFSKYVYPKKIKERPTDTLLFYKAMMPYKHRMFFLGDSIIQKIAKEELESSNRHRLNPYRENYVETKDQKILRISSEVKHVTSQRIDCLIREHRDSIFFKKDITHNAGIYFVNSFEIIAIPVRGNEEVLINALIESNKNK